MESHPLWVDGRPHTKIEVFTDRYVQSEVFSTRIPATWYLALCWGQFLCQSFFFLSTDLHVQGDCNHRSHSKIAVPARCLSHVPVGTSTLAHYASAALASISLLRSIPGSMCHKTAGGTYFAD